MSRVQVIPAKLMLHTGQPLNALYKRKVAGYARVSTDSDEQFTSYEAQIDYYTQYITSHSDWQFVKVYTDEGISGTNTKKREGFNQMIEDALAGKIDLIVTKSVSRFARNTVDSLVTVRKLKEKGVEIFFEKENIYTLDSKGELLITIMSSLAQEESRSISENVTWGQRKRFADGKIMLAYKRFLGYEKGPDGFPAIVEEEAKIVREIYELFLSGLTPAGIAKRLTAEGHLTPGGGDVWRPTTVFSILQNEKYKGAALLQKKFTTDFLTKKQKVNEGEVPQYYVENSHPAIIDPQIWELTQIEIERRQAIGKEYSGNSVFSARLVCGECGNLFTKRSWQTKGAGDKVAWFCKQKYKNGKTCDSPLILEDTIREKFIEAVNEIIDGREQVLENCRRVYDELIDTSALDKEIEDCIKECEIISELIKRLVNENATVPMDQSEYQRNYSSYETRFNAETAKLEGLKTMREAQIKRAELLSAFMFEVHEKDNLIDSFDKKLWLATIDVVVVGHDGKLTFKFKNGKEITK